MNPRWMAVSFFLAGGNFLTAQPAENPALVYRIAEISAPTTARPTSLILARGTDRTVWLLWLEPTKVGLQTLRCAAFDSVRQSWGTPHTVSEFGYPGVARFRSALPPFSSSATNQDPAYSPHNLAFTVGANGKLTAAWTVNNYGKLRVYFSRSSDHGVTWTPPALISQHAAFSDFPALATLADGRVLATWLGRSSNSSPTGLFVRILDQPAATIDLLISPSVNETSTPALTAFPDGGALLSFRGRSADNVRDVFTTQRTSAGWSEPRSLNSDLWRSPESPSSAPRFASDGGRVSAAWFTAADGEGRVLLTTSADAGAHFLLPLKADLGRATGPVDTVLLHDGAALVTWVEGPTTKPGAPPGGVWIRRASPQASLDGVVLLTTKDVQSTSLPRAVLARDFSHENPDAQLLVAYAGNEGLHTLSVTIPEAELLAAATESCGCADALPAQLTGFPFRGTLSQAFPAEGILVVKHPDLPGLLLAGTHRFRATPSVVATVTPGQEFIGHVERRADDWWLFDVRVLIAPPDKPLSIP